MILEIDEAASAEVEEATRWYEDQRPGLGLDLLIAIDRVFASLCEDRRDAVQVACMARVASL